MIDADTGFACSSVKTYGATGRLHPQAPPSVPVRTYAGAPLSLISREVDLLTKLYMAERGETDYRVAARAVLADPANAALAGAYFAGGPR